MAAVAFLGTPEAAVPSLRALVSAGHDVVLVVSQPDRRRGRGGALVPSPVKQAATALGLAVTDRLDDVAGCGADVGVVVAYGRIVPQRLLDVVPMVNLHFSLLPRWRGAAPVERALLAGDRTTGVCLMRLEAGLDTGPVLARVEIDIVGGETAADLTARLADVGAELLVESLRAGVEGLGPGEPQRGEPTYAAKIDPAELCLDWSQPAEAVVRVTRLGRAFTDFRGQRLRVLRAELDVSADGGERAGSPRPMVPGPGPAPGERPQTLAPGHGQCDAGQCDAGQSDAGHRRGTVLPPGTLVAVATVIAGDGRGIRLLEVQPEGRRPVDGPAWWNGARPSPGERLGTGSVTDGGDHPHR